MIHLHRHSEYSPLDGMGTADQYAARAVELGQTALGLTDHATLAGALHHVKACRDNGIIPVIGVEAYFRDNRTHTKDDGVESNKAMHLCLHASSMKGWHSLLRIASAAYTTGDKHGQGYYGKPVVDWELLEKFNEGLFCSTACIYGPVNEALLRGDDTGAARRLERLATIFTTKEIGDRLWLEIMPHDFENQRTANLHTLTLAGHYGLPVIATGDAHMPYKEWKDTHLILMMHATKQTFAERKKKVEAGEDVYGSELDTLFLMSDNEMEDAFARYHPDIPSNMVRDAIDQTDELVKKMRMYVVDRDPKLPRIEGDSEQILREWMKDGMARLVKRWHEYDPSIDIAERSGSYWARLEYEFDVLKRNGVTDYFVIVGDLMRWAKSDEGVELGTKKKPIRCGHGRGSAAGSLVSYVIGITNVDPIAYGLLFERFMNPDRKGLPDIDLDFDAERRPEIKAYLQRKYGRDHVADIIAWTRFAPRALIEDLGRIYSVPYPEQDKVKKTITPLERDIMKLKQDNEVLADFMGDWQELARHAERLDDQVHRASKHAAGVVITKRPTAEYMPLQLNKSPKGDSVVTAWSDAADFPIISDFGFLKLDVLGLMDLTRQEHATEMMFARAKLNDMKDKHLKDPADLEILFDPDAVDPEVMQAFADGLTIGVFQFSGRGITRLLRKIKPDRIFDVIAANALYRPGAMKVAFDYAKRKHGLVPESEWYWHPAVEPFLSETYGVLTYQEQVMELVKVIGGFSGGQADSMRKAMSKLYRLPGDQAQQFMQQFKDTWDEGCRKNGIDDKARDIIWDQILDNGDYSFNKSHSGSYGLEAYQDMWLKVHHSLEFYAAILTRPSKEKGFVEMAVREARMMGVDIKPPDVNRSEEGFTVDGDSILYGLSAVKDIGDKAAQDIMEARKEKPFESYEDFCCRLSQHAKKAGMPLIRAGGFDSIEDRARLLSVVDKHVNAKKLEQLQAAGEPIPRWTVAEHINHSRTLKKPRPVPDTREEPSKKQLVELEAEMLGAKVTDPRIIDENREILDQFVYTEEEFEDLEKGDEVVVAGEIIALKERTTKNGDPYAILDLAYGTDQFSCKLWTEVWRRYSGVLREESSAIIAFGTKDVWNDNESVTILKLQDAAEFCREQQEESESAD